MNGPKVRLSYGTIRGSTTNGVHCFKGIPYAAPPVGELRWRAPAPPIPWTGERLMVEFGASAMQGSLGAMGEMIGIAAGPTDENCLTVNVWTANVTDEESPVMVWIHGGGNVVGSSAQPRFNGEYFVQRGGIVLVTVNYRLGAFGFLHSPELGASGNEALLDQIAGAALGAQRDPQVRRQSQRRHRLRPERGRHGHHAADGHGSGGRVFRSGHSDERRAVAADPARRSGGHCGAIRRKVRRLRRAAFGAGATASRLSAAADGRPARGRGAFRSRCATGR
jgi:hypothetical protein